MEEASGEDLEWFFDQWFRTTATLDYAIREATASQAADGRWTTRVTVERSGDAWMPITLRVGDVEQRLDSRERVQTVEIVTDERPAEAVLDPEYGVIETNRGNNRRAVGSEGPLREGRPTSQQASRKAGDGIEPSSSGGFSPALYP